MKPEPIVLFEKEKEQIKRLTKHVKYLWLAIAVLFIYILIDLIAR